MARHLDALALLHVVWGIFGLLTGGALGVLAGGTANGLPPATAAASPERMAVWILAIGALALAAGGTAMWLVGRGLRRRWPIARLAALLLAVPDLLVVPFGTALGVYTFWVLLNDEARVTFGAPPRNAPGPIGMEGV